MPWAISSGVFGSGGGEKVGMKVGGGGPPVCVCVGGGGTYLYTTAERNSKSYGSGYQLSIK